MKVFITQHAIDRFRERIADLPLGEAVRLLTEAALSCPSLPGLYEPEQKRRVKAGEYSFWIVVGPPPKEGFDPVLITIYPDSQQKIEQYKARKQSRINTALTRRDERDEREERGRFQAASQEIKLRPCALPGCTEKGNTSFCHLHFPKLTLAQKIQSAKKMTREQRATFVREVAAQMGAR